MHTSLFYGLPNRHPSHMPWRLQHKSRDAVRGAIRGAAALECLLHPSQAKAMQRRIRVRLVGAYIRRFGMDEFSVKFSASKVVSQSTNNWLRSGYAWWRERIFGRVPESIQACHQTMRPNPSIERTVSSGLCPLPTVAHVKR